MIESDSFERRSERAPIVFSLQQHESGEQQYNVTANASIVEAWCAAWLSGDSEELRMGGVASVFEMPDPHLFFRLEHFFVVDLFSLCAVKLRWKVACSRVLHPAHSCM